MTSYTLSQRTFRPVPPLKGSFPLDHEGSCKEMMIKYMTCLNENKYENMMCREIAKEYLACRMDNDLMVREDWSKLGFFQQIKET